MQTGFWLSQRRKEVLSARAGWGPGTLVTAAQCMTPHGGRTQNQTSAVLRLRSPGLAGEAVPCKVPIPGGSRALPTWPAAQLARGRSQHRAGTQAEAPLVRTGIRVPAKNRAMMTVCHICSGPFPVTPPLSELTLTWSEFQLLSSCAPVTAGGPLGSRGERVCENRLIHTWDGGPGRTKSLF